MLLLSKPQQAAWFTVNTAEGGCFISVNLRTRTTCCRGVCYREDVSSVLTSGPEQPAVEMFVPGRMFHQGLPQEQNNLL